MAVTIACTHCQASLSMPESMAGRQVRCPKCQQVFTCPQSLAASPSPQPEPPKPESRKRPATMPSTGNPFEFDESTAPAAAASAPVSNELAFDEGTTQNAYLGRTGWGRVRSSFLLLLISAGCYYVAFLCYSLSQIFHDPMTPPPRSGNLLEIITWVIVLVALILASLAQSKCCSAPASSGARGAAQTAALLMVVAAFMWTVLLSLVFLAKSTGGLPPPLANLVPLLIMVYLGCMLGSFLIFLFYLALSGSALQSRSLMSNTLAFALFFFLSPFLYAGLLYFKGMIGGNQGFDSIESYKFWRLWVPLILVTILMGWFCLLSLSFKSAIERAGRREST